MSLIMRGRGRKFTIKDKSLTRELLKIQSIQLRFGYLYKNIKLILSIRRCTPKDMLGRSSYQNN